MRLLYGFFCEDLRTEASGQITAVGLWGAQCNVAAFPGLRSFAFHAFVENTDEEAPFVITIAVPGQPEAPPVQDVIRPTPNTVGQNFNIMIGPVPLDGPGEIRVRFQIQAREPVDTTFTLRIALGVRTTDPPAPVALQ